MGHIEKHFSKSSNELALRMMKEWKLFCGVLYDDATEQIKNVLDNMKFDFTKKEVIILKFNKEMGYGYNRLFQKITSKYVRVIIVGNNENYEIITAYPELERGTITNEYFDFLNNKIIDDENKMFKLFLKLYSLHKYELRFVENKNSYIKFSTKEYFVKIKKNHIIIANNKNIQKTYPYNDIDFIFFILNAVDSFVPTYSLFGIKSIFDIIDEQI